jgi:Domain of unknown function (DUF6798)
LSAATPQNVSQALRPGRWLKWADCALVFLAIAMVFVVHTGGHVPEPNEPYYLAKAKHYWDPDWIAGDFFLDSADSHWVFYVTLGWLTRWMSLPVLAWTGRLFTWGLLAVAWQRLSFAVAPRWGLAALSAAGFVCLNEGCHMAGEWVVGGFEAKPIAYALVFAALAECVRNRWNATWLLLGAASAFHVLVGGWCAVAVGFCWITSGATRVPLRSMLGGLAGGLGLSLFGLAPALALTRGIDPAVVVEANHIYVYHRLSHHLYFNDFPTWFIVRYAVLLVCWLALCRFVPADASRWRLRRVVAGAVLIALIGVGISSLATLYPVWAAGWLRFYWFRVSDAMLPLGAALEVAAALDGLWQRDRITGNARLARGAPVAVAAVVVLYLGAHAAVSPPSPVPRADKPGKVDNFDDWRATCRWVAEKSPADARFLTPRRAQTFKWYAQRSEVATWKDIPQDARSIVEWWGRLKEIYADDPSAGDPRWRDSLAELSAARLAELGARYGAGFVVTEAEPRLDLPCVYRNNTYAIYELPHGGPGSAQRR